MKTKSVLLVFALLVLGSCRMTDGGDDIIWDMNPVVVRLTVQDTKGTDLIANGTYDISKVSIVTAGKTVGVYTQEEMRDWNYEKGVKPAPTTRYCMPHQYGAYVEKGNDGRWVICVGEYDGAKNFKDEMITVIWPDGSKDVIIFSRRVKFGRKDVDVRMEWTLNHERVSEKNSPILRIVKE